MLKLDLLEEKKKTDKPCKGHFWRGSVNIFISDKGKIFVKKELRLLKKMSCPGCDVCGWLFDYLHEDIDRMENALNDIKQGCLYTYVVHTVTDWESGIKEFDCTEFVKVKE